MNWRNVDPAAWFLCGEYVADVMNHLAEKSLGWRPPLEVLSGSTVDISILLVFNLWDLCYVARHQDSDHPMMPGSDSSSEILCRFVGFAHSVGHALTFKFLNLETKQVLSRSWARLAAHGENNLRADAAADALPEHLFITSPRDEQGDEVILPTIDMSQCPFSVDLPPPKEDIPWDIMENAPEKGE